MSMVLVSTSYVYLFLTEFEIFYQNKEIAFCVILQAIFA